MTFDLGTSGVDVELATVSSMDSTLTSVSYGDPSKFCSLACSSIPSKGSPFTLDSTFLHKRGGFTVIIDSLKSDEDDFFVD